MLDLFTTFAKLKGAWDKVQKKRRDNLRPALWALVLDAQHKGDTPENITEKHLDKILEASLPISEVGGDLLRGAADALEGKK